MYKKIAVQKGLDEGKETVEGQGYAVVDMDDTREPIDAIIYSGSFSVFDYSGSFTNVYTGGDNKFVTMINADEKTLAEIVDILARMKGY